jgi:hypothetical protein
MLASCAIIPSQKLQYIGWEGGEGREKEREREREE